jgi:L-lactate dehydrogenase complex protein LldE
LNQSKPIQLFRTCLVDSFFENVGQAVLATLEATGVEILMPEGQTCCGQPAYNAGFWEQARQMAQHTIQVLEPAPGPIVIPSGSCTHMIRHGYPTIFRDDPDWQERAERIAARAYEWSEYIVAVRGVEGFKSAFAGKVAYHASCHLTRGLGVEKPPKLLLRNSMPETAISFLPEECCGFGGIFAVEHPELSTAMIDRKIEHIQASSAELVTGCDVSCLMQIESRLRRIGSLVRCAHLAQLFTDRDPELGS